MGHGKDGTMWWRQVLERAEEADREPSPLVAILGWCLASAVTIGAGVVFAWWLTT